MAGPRAPDLIVVGADIAGLAHALAAARRGLAVLVMDRDAQANGASIRNFGFVTVTGQARGRVWSLAQRSADVWRDIAPRAGIHIEHEGLLMLARRPEAADVLGAFARTEMGADCDWIGTGAIAGRYPMLQGRFAAALFSHADLRVESRTAIPALARWLGEAHGVRFRRCATVCAVEPGLVILNDGQTLAAPLVIVCPGDSLVTLFPREIAQARLTRAFLQMLRLAPPGWRLPGAVMSDLSLVRYPGYAALPEAEALHRRLRTEEAEALNHGIHLIVVQSRDGSLVVGDSHSYGATPPPFASSAVDSAMIGQFVGIFGAAPPVVERWTGTYASGADHSIVRAPMPGVRLVIITSGTGASTSFALAEEVIDDLLADNRQERTMAAGRPSSRCARCSPPMACRSARPRRARTWAGPSATISPCCWPSLASPLPGRPPMAHCPTLRTATRSSPRSAPPCARPRVPAPPSFPAPRRSPGHCRRAVSVSAPARATAAR